MFQPAAPEGIAAAIDVEATAQGPCSAGLFRGAGQSFERDGSDVVDPGADDNAFVTCRDSAGENRWTRTFGGTGPVSSRGLALSGSFLVAAGSFAGTADLGDGEVAADSEDLFLIATDVATGEHAASFVFSAGAEERTFGLAAQGDRLCMVGEFSGSLDLGVDERMANGESRDAYLAVFELAEPLR